MSIRDSARTAVDWSLGSRTVSRLVDRRPPGTIRILAYHGVPSRAVFAQHVQVLASEADPVSADEMAAAVLHDASLPKRPVLITFDDGDITVLENAVPILEAAGVPSISFVISDLIGTDQPFWWAEVEEHLRRGALPRSGLPPQSEALVAHLKTVPDAERIAVIDGLREQTGTIPIQRNLSPEDLHRMAARGMQVGSHTRTHPCLDQCEDDKVREEVLGSADRLSEFMGARPAHFAYPNGNVDSRARRAVQDAGHTSGFLFDHALATTRQDPLRLSRVRIDATAPVTRLRAVLSGAHPRLHAARGTRLPTRPPRSTRS